MPVPARTLILDLDGTLCLGDEPVRRYAAAAFGGLGDAAAREARHRLEGFLDGLPGAVPGARDGYQAVAALATAAGVPDEALGTAYRASRADVDAWLGAVAPPPGCVELLAGLDRVHRVLVTNAPPAGLDRVLDALGVRGVLDEVVTEARKPDGMPAALDTAVRPGASLAGVGDIWENDLAAIAARGGSTFLIDRFATGDGEPTRRARSMEGLYAAILDWADALS